MKRNVSKTIKNVVGLLCVFTVGKAIYDSSIKKLKNEEIIQEETSSEDHYVQINTLEE